MRMTISPRYCGADTTSVPLLDQRNRRREWLFENNSNCIGVRLAAAVVIAGEHIERFVRAFDDVSQAAELTVEVAFEFRNFAGIVGIENCSVECLTTQAGEQK